MASNTLYPPVVNNTEPAFITMPKIINGDLVDPWQPGELKVYFKFSALNSDLDHRDNISVHATIHLKESGSSIVTIEDGENTGDGTFSGSRRLRATQIILNLKPEQIPNSDLWYITLRNDDLDQRFNRLIETADEKADYYGWLPGSVYKIQIRLSEKLCVNTLEEPNAEENQQKWLYDHASQFSEWSTVIYSKCISDYNIHHADKYYFIENLETFEVMPTPDAVYKDDVVKYTGSTTEHYTEGYCYTCVETVDQETTTYSWEHQVSNPFPQTFQGNIDFKHMDVNREYYSSCLLRLFESNENQEKGDLIEEVTIYPNDISLDSYNYTIKYDFKPSNNNEKYYYYIEFSFVTENKYQSQVFTEWFMYPESTADLCNYKLETVDTVNHSLVEKIRDNNRYYTSLGKENENACVGLKIKYDPASTIEFNWNPVNLRIIRSSEDTNFTVWEVIKYTNLNFEEAPATVDALNNLLSNMDIIYDYTIESNTFYQYGIQSMVDDDPELWSKIRKLTKTIDNPNYDPFRDSIDLKTIEVDAQIQRDFEYTYLTGKNQKQLKIKFNDNISNYMPQVYDNKLEPIGSQFPYTYRNAKTNYRTFPIAGTISFEMDDNETFLVNGDLDIYNGYERVRNLHKEDWTYGKYNYGYERRFRQKVIDFLTNGEFKLFKSATEGNLLVRLRDVNCTPNQQLSRLIYNFSANIDEVDINNLDNLKKYGIIYPGTFVTNWTNVKIIIPSANKDIDLPHSHGTIDSTPSNIPPVKEE